MNNKIIKINSCEVCDNSDLIPVLNLGLNPLCYDLVNLDEDRICL